MKRTDWMMLGFVLFIMLSCFCCKAQTVDSVRTYLDSIQVKHPEIVTAQAVLETGWFKCKYCSLQKNNIFGFLIGDEFLVFETWQASCDYYKWWQDQLYISGDYFRFLTRVGYAADPNYNKKLKQIIQMI